MQSIRITYITSEDFKNNIDNLDKAPRRSIVYENYFDLTDAMNEFRNTFDGYRMTKAEYIERRSDKKVSMTEFLRIYDQALNADDRTESGIYGEDVTIHWNGIYCNVGDGATAYNHIISNIESVIDENGED